MFGLYTSLYIFLSFVLLNLSASIGILYHSFVFTSNVQGFV